MTTRMMITMKMIMIMMVMAMQSLMLPLSDRGHDSGLVGWRGRGAPNKHTCTSDDDDDKDDDDDENDDDDDEDDEDAICSHIGAKGRTTGCRAGSGEA